MSCTAAPCSRDSSAACPLSLAAHVMRPAHPFFLGFPRRLLGSRIPLCELVPAALAAEIVGCSFVLALKPRGGRINLHAANGIARHGYFPPICSRSVCALPVRPTGSIYLSRARALFPRSLACAPERRKAMLRPFLSFERTRAGKQTHSVPQVSFSEVVRFATASDPRLTTRGLSSFGHIALS
jgi:hypothetical protein